MTDDQSSAPAAPESFAIRLVVIEDQPVARRHLLELVSSMEGVSCVGDASDGISALELIARVRPDVAFLDIEMPGLSGLEVLRRARPRPLVIFTTAWDHHAVAAFELQALDYVLKPFGRDRIEAALERARATLRLRALAESTPPSGDMGHNHDPGGSTDQLSRAETALHDSTANDGPLRRLFVHSRGRIVPVDLDSVEHVQANGDYVLLKTGSAAHLVRVTMRSLLARLDPSRFIRIHRSHVVNLDRVSALVPQPDGRIEVELASGARVVSSRTRAPKLMRRLRHPLS